MPEAITWIVPTFKVLIYKGFLIQLRVGRSMLLQLMFQVETLLAITTNHAV